MNRRGFIKSLCVAVGAAVAAPVLTLLPKAISQAKLARIRGLNALFEQEVWFNNPKGYEWPTVSREYESGGYDPEHGWWKETVKAGAQDV